MPRPKHMIAAFAAALLALTAAPALAQVREVEQSGRWTHAATGTEFAERVAGFDRVSITEYTSDGRDASASYRLRRDNGWALVTLYVYPAPSPRCERTFAGIKRDITGAAASAQFVSEGRAASPSGRAANAALLARFSYPAGAINPDFGELRTEAYLFCAQGGEWLVSYRATWTPEVDFGPDVERLLHAIDWPKAIAE